MPQYMDQSLASIVQSANSILVFADSLLHPCFYAQWAELEVLLAKYGKKLIVTTADMKILERLSAAESSLSSTRKNLYRAIYKSLLAKSLAGNSASRTVRIEKMSLTSQSAMAAFSKFFDDLFELYPRICVFTQSPDWKSFLSCYPKTQIVVHSFIVNAPQISPSSDDNPEKSETNTGLSRIDTDTPSEEQSPIERVLWTDSGEKVQVCERFNGGAEGAIHKTRRLGYVAKIYHTPPSYTMCSKLKAMVQLQPTLQHIAYPVNTLRDTENKIVGVLLPYAVGRQLSVVLGCDYKTGNYRLAKEYPYLNIRTFIRIAKSVAMQVEALHQLGIILGDINLENVLVELPKKTSGEIITWLVDIDSVQFREYPCCVERPAFVHPRHLQSSSQIRSYTKSLADDNFALSVLIFMTLMRGAGPYQAPRTNIEEATRRCQFPYVDAAKRELFPPNSSIKNWNQLPENLQATFRRAFFSANQNPDLLQIPTSREWVDILASALYSTDIRHVSSNNNSILFRRSSERSPLYEERKDGKYREGVNSIVD